VRSHVRHAVRRVFPTLRVGLLGLLLAACGPAEQPNALDTSPTIPGETWEVVSATDLPAYGWDPARLEQTTVFLADSANTTALVVVENGRVAYTYGDIERVSYLASVRKSILAMLYGVWVEDGTIDLDATLEELEMDDVGGLLPIERQATVDHLVTARSGVYHAASNGGDNLADAPERGSQTPGAYMLYSNWDFNAAGGAFELTTGRDLFDELERQQPQEVLGPDEKVVHLRTGENRVHEALRLGLPRGPTEQRGGDDQVVSALALQPTAERVRRRCCINTRNAL